MFSVNSYGLSVLLCIITMFCWGSWANTQKLAGKSWRFELFYWDYVLGILLFSTISALTLGSFGESGRSFIQDLTNADSHNVLMAFIGGIVFNAANILLVAAITIAGMAVAFPIGIGIALVLGVLINYFAAPSGNPIVLFVGVALIAGAILLDARAYKKLKGMAGVSTKGLLLSVISGILMALFYRFVADSMDINFATPALGKLTPYSAVFIFSIGVFASNLIFNTIIMKKPISGTPLSLVEYFKGKFSSHFWGVIGGVIWCFGMSSNILASGNAGFAISYGLGQGATLIAAFWGVFIWKEFKGASKNINPLLFLMFLFYLAGIGFIVYSKFC